MVMQISLIQFNNLLKAKRLLFQQISDQQNDSDATAVSTNSKDEQGQSTDDNISSNELIEPVEGGIKIEGLNTQRSEAKIDSDLQKPVATENALKDESVQDATGDTSAISQEDVKDESVQNSSDFKSDEPIVEAGEIQENKQTPVASDSPSAAISLGEESKDESEQSTSDVKIGEDSSQDKENLKDEEVAKKTLEAEESSRVEKDAEKSDNQEGEKEDKSKINKDSEKSDKGLNSLKAKIMGYFDNIIKWFKETFDTRDEKIKFFEIELKPFVLLIKQNKIALKPLLTNNLDQLSEESQRIIINFQEKLQEIAIKIYDDLISFNKEIKKAADKKELQKIYNKANKKYGIGEILKEQNNVNAPEELQTIIWKIMDRLKITEDIRPLLMAIESNIIAHTVSLAKESDASQQNVSSPNKIER